MQIDGPDDHSVVGFLIGFALIVGPILVGLAAWLGPIDTSTDSNKPMSPYPDTCYEAPHGQVEC
jgi:hypothetical protein